MLFRCVCPVEQAKKEKKGVFIYFHFDGCGACVKMEKTTFRDKDVADFYNSNFISLNVNTLKGEGVETNKIYNVKMHPTFLYLDENGIVLHKAVGIFSPDEFIAHAENSLYPLKSLGSYKEQYKSGKREPDFLFKYCYKLRDAYELDSLVINEYLNTQTEDDLNQEKNIKFIYEFAVHNNTITMDLNSPAFVFLLNNQEKFDQYFDESQVNTRAVWILNRAVYEAINKKDKTAFKKINKLLEEFDTGERYLFKEMDGRTTGILLTNSLVLSSQMAYYEKWNMTSQYNKALKSYVKKIWEDSDALNGFAWGVVEDTKSSETKLKKAVDCVIKSIELNSNYANNDTYAWLLFRLKKYDEALLQAEKAIAKAKENSQGFKETSDLIEMIHKNK